MTADSYLRNGPAEAETVLVLAHGAGAAMDTPCMQAVAEGVGGHGIGTLRFEFPYMQRRRAEGGRRPPDRLPKLQDAYRQVVAECEAERVVIGGKSMGGRVASTLADELGVAGLVCLGYPFHPPGKPERLRTEHLIELKTPTLIVQGTRDPFGGPEEVASYGLSPRIKTVWLEDGDHSFKPRRASGYTLEQHLETAIAQMVKFCTRLS